MLYPTLGNVGYGQASAFACLYVLGGFQGQATDIKIHAERILQTKSNLNKILAKHTGQNLKKVEEDTERDNFMEASAAVKYGLVDKIIS